MAAAEKEFDGQTCLKRRTILRLGVPKERGLFTTTSGGRTKASPKRDRRSGTRRSRVKRANSSGKDERSEFLTGEEQNKGSYQSGQMGQTVNLLAYAFGGSNPSPPTTRKSPAVEVWIVSGPLPVGKGVMLHGSITAESECPKMQANVSSRRCEDVAVACSCEKASGSSSVGRALAFQAKGRGFEPRLPLFFIETKQNNNLNAYNPWQKKNSTGRNRT